MKIYSLVAGLKAALRGRNGDSLTCAIYWPCMRPRKPQCRLGESPGCHALSCTEGDEN